MRRRVSVAEAVAQRTQKTDTCWIWIGNVNPDHGYGRLGIGQKNHSAHRLAYELACHRDYERARRAAA